MSKLYTKSSKPIKQHVVIIILILTVLILIIYDYYQLKPKMVKNKITTALLLYEFKNYYYLLELFL